MLLHCVGPDVQELFETLDGGTSFAEAVKALDAHFTPEKNIPFEHHSFRQAKQQTGETVDDFCIRLKSLASTCDFGEATDDHIRDQIIDKCESNALRRRLLRESKLGWKTLLSIARAAEAADRQAASME